MTYLSKRYSFANSVYQIKGFSLIELMVVMAIMAVVMSLSGGLFQQSINQQERHVELEKVRQLFKQLTYNAYYQGKAHDVRLEENKLLVYTKNKSNLFNALIEKQEGGVAQQQNAVSDDDQLNEDHKALVQEITFNQLLFVAQDFNVSTKGIVSPNQFSIFSGENIRSFQLTSVFVAND